MMAREALGVLAGMDEVPDVLFLEIDYEKEAYQVMRYVREQRAESQTKLVAMVLQEEKADIERALKEINVCYLVKPFQIQEALALISDSISWGAASCGTQTREREEKT
jgi:DNA-binding response OmpR family regulator